MRQYPLLFGAVRHCKLIGTDPEYQALRERNEQRLATIKKQGMLYESATSREQAIRRKVECEQFVDTYRSFSYP